MFIKIADCEKARLLPDKFTAVMATSQSSIDVMMFSIFSLLMRSKANFEHLIVAINGPDSRTGNPEIQDKKQSFLEELRESSWSGGAMPLTVARVWSRVGHSQALEMGLTWVHTEFYALIHDDVIVENDWTQPCLEAFQKNPRLALMVAPPMFSVRLHVAKWQGKMKLGLPNLNTAFIACRKPILAEEGVSWSGYHIPCDYYFDSETLNQYRDINNFLMSHSVGTDTKQDVNTFVDQSYGFMSVDVGGLAFDRLIKKGYDIIEFPGSITHLGGQSWIRLNRGVQPDVAIKYKKLLEEMKSSEPGYYKLYHKYTEWDLQGE